MTRVSETTPLLGVSSESPITQGGAETLDANKIQSTTETADVESSRDADQGQQRPQEEEPPFPVGQVILLCYARIIEPVAFFSIFPYVNQMIEKVGDIREEDVGFYSGLIESLFSLTQMFCMVSWGRAADRFGRKPVLVCSVIGVSIATCLFGISQSIAQMIIFRCLAGVFAGTIVTVKTSLAEITTPKTQAKAFSWFAFSVNLGIFIGPIIGGVLANPATQYPKAFGGSRFLHNYPYALPSIVGGIIGFSAAVLSVLFLKETLQSKKDGKASAKPPMSTFELLKHPGVSMTLFLWCLTSLMGLANTAVTPVFWFTSVPLGGLGFSPMQISIFLATAGISQAIWLLFIFPPLHRRWGTGGILKNSCWLFGYGFLVAPITNLFLRHGLKAGFWAVMPASLVVCSGAAMAFTCMQLAINNISPTPAVLGTINAISLAMVSGIRAVAPALFASLFATGVRTQVLAGYLVWVVMVAIAVLLVVCVQFLPKKAEGEMPRNEAGEETA